MAFTKVKLDEKKSNTWFPGKNIVGGIKRATDVAGQAIRAVGDPLGYSQNIISNRLGLPQSNTFTRNLTAPEIPSLKPAGQSEDYAQHLIGQLALGGATGAINPQSILKSTGQLASNVVASDIGQQAAKSLGAGPVLQTLGGLAGVGLKNTLKPSAIQEKFQPYKKWLYNEVKKEGKTKIDSGELNTLAKEFIEDEQRRSGGKNPYIRRLSNWINETKGNQATAEDIHKFKKDINEYRYHKFESPSYLKALEKEVHSVIDKAGKSKRTDSNLTLPSWSKNLKKADKLHKILSIQESTPGLEKGIDWLFKFSPSIGKALKYTAKAGTAPAQLITQFPKKTWEFFVDEVLKGIQKHPAAFQPEIKRLNHIISKKEERFKKVKLV